MPWFKASCKDGKCELKANFPAKDVDAATKHIEANHRAHLCNSETLIEPSTNRTESYNDPLQL